MDNIAENRKRNRFILEDLDKVIKNNPANIAIRIDNNPMKKVIK
jgi:hypothetical protein